MTRAKSGMRILRGVLLVIAVGAAAAAALVLLTGPAGVELGTWWHGTAPESLNLTQAVTQRYLHPVVWTHGILPVLLMPAAGVFIAVAIVAMALLSATLLWKRRAKR